MKHIWMWFSLFLLVFTCSACASENNEVQSEEVQNETSDTTIDDVSATPEPAAVSDEAELFNLSEFIDDKLFESSHITVSGTFYEYTLTASDAIALREMLSESSWVHFDPSELEDGVVENIVHLVGDDMSSISINYDQGLIFISDFDPDRQVGYQVHHYVYSVEKQLLDKYAETIERLTDYAIER